MGIEDGTNSMNDTDQNAHGLLDFNHQTLHGDEDQVQANETEPQPLTEEAAEQGSNSDIVRSYLEKAGIIGKNRNVDTPEKEKDLYRWKLQPAVSRSRGSDAQQPLDGKEGQGQGDNSQRAWPDPQRHNADVGAGAAQVSANRGTSDDADKKNGKVSDGAAGMGNFNNDNVDMAKNRGKDYGAVGDASRAAGVVQTGGNNASRGNIARSESFRGNAENRVGIVGNRAEANKVQSVQYIIRSVTAADPETSVNNGDAIRDVGKSKNSGSDSLKNPGSIDHPHNMLINDQKNKDIGIGNGSDSLQAVDSVGDLLQKAGVISGGKNQQPRKEGALGKSQPLKEDLQHPAEESSAEKRSSKRKMCVEFLPGTGNILFQFATAYAIAKDRNMTLAIPESISKFSEAFDLVGSNDGVISFDQSRCEDAADASNYKRGIYDETFLRRITGEVDVKLHGYFQSYRYFEHWEEALRDILTFKDDVQTKAMEAINVLHFKKYGESLHHLQTSEGITLVGVHIRRHPVNGNRADRKEEGYRVATLEYIKHAMEEMRNRHFNQGNKIPVRFYVVNDDEGWAEAQLGIKDLPDTMLVTKLSWAPTLALLANMDHVITTVGALGWWGAWLAGGDVIYYQDFVEPGSKMDTAYLAQDLFPPIWTPMV